MMAIGYTTKGMVKPLKFLPMKVSIKVLTSKIRCMDKVNTLILAEKPMMASGTKTSNMAQDYG
jgi:hypothetical protein